MKVLVTRDTIFRCRKHDVIKIPSCDRWRCPACRRDYEERAAAKRRAKPCKTCGGVRVPLVRNDGDIYMMCPTCSRARYDRRKPASCLVGPKVARNRAGHIMAEQHRLAAIEVRLESLQCSGTHFFDQREAARRQYAELARQDRVQIANCRRPQEEVRA